MFKCKDGMHTEKIRLEWDDEAVAAHNGNTRPRRERRRKIKNDQVDSVKRRCHSHEMIKRSKLAPKGMRRVNNSPGKVDVQFVHALRPGKQEQVSLLRADGYELCCLQRCAHTRPHCWKERQKQVPPTIKPKSTISNKLFVQARKVGKAIKVLCIVSRLIYEQIHGAAQYQLSEVALRIAIHHKYFLSRVCESQFKCRSKTR